MRLEAAVASAADGAAATAVEEKAQQQMVQVARRFLTAYVEGFSRNLIVHGDLKNPANVMLKGDLDLEKQVVLMRFMMSRHYSAT